MANSTRHPAIFNLGFRAFFSGAGVFATVSIAFWLLLFNHPGLLTFSTLSPFQWHAHEMIYGYGVAVIAGFLLTAVKNWTGLQTPHGYTLAALFLLWLCARVLWLAGDRFLLVAAIFDLGFILALMVAIAKPIVIKKQWRQIAVISKLILLGLGNLAFYLGATGYLENGIHLALYGGLYLVIGLILTIGRRVIPFFIKNGVDYPVELMNSKWLDMSSLVIFMLFFISELFLQQDWFSSWMALIMFFVTAVRLVGWYTPGIWKTPLLWSLFFALGFIDLAFLLFALQDWLSISPFLATHAFAVGGIGIITMGMMARVSIGHSGRNLKEPPQLLRFALVLLLLGAIIRIFMPILVESQYAFWITLSGSFWVLSFATFCYAFLPILSKPRIDQKYG